MDKQGVENTGVIVPSASSIIVDHRYNRSFLTACLHFLIKPFRPRLISPSKSERTAEGSPKLKPLVEIQATVIIKEVQICNVWIYELTARLPGGIKYRPKHDLYYFAGGSFVSPASKHHWKFLGELTEQLPEYRIHLVSYPLSPHNRASQSLPLLQALAVELATRADKNKRNVTFAGDSSGGNIAMSLGLFVADTAIKDGDRRTQLKNILLISPTVDLRKTNPAIQEIEKKDPVATIAHTKWVSSQWVDEKMDEENPAVSPIKADLTSLRTLGVKVHGVIGTYDLLYPDALVFRDRLSEVGVSGEWLEWEKQMHCFPLAFPYHLPESVKSKNWVLELLRNNA